MNAIADALAGSQIGLRQRLFGVDGGADGSFATIFGASLGSPMSGRGRVEEALAKLSERFPGLSIKAGEAGEGVEGAKKAFAESEDEEQVAVGSSLLAGMIGNAGLTEKVENIISGFLQNGAGGSLFTMPGSVTIRAVSITITTVRYSEFAKSSDSGEVLAAADLKTGFHDKLAEMFQKLFGGGASDEEEASEDGNGETDGVSLAELARYSPFSSLSAVGMWSVEFFYASAFISGSATPGSARASEETEASDETESLDATDAANATVAATDESSEAESGAETAAAKKSDPVASLIDGWKYMSILAGSITSTMSSYLMPNLLGMSAAGFGVNMSGFGFTANSSFQQTMSGLGLEFGGFQQTGEGYLFNMRERRNLLAELMELYEGKRKEIDGEETSDYEADPARETEAAPAEVA